MQHWRGEDNKKYLARMTRKKARKSPPKGDSANGSNHEAKAGTADGPEADRENVSIRQPENDRIQVPYAKCACILSKSN